MSANDDAFVAWEEHIICHERGSRVVHYHLKDTFGDLVLAVIGTERSIRHMAYVVSDEFLEAYGSNESINASTKWRARREVVDWLTSMVSNEGSPLHVSNAQINGSAQNSGSFGASMTGLSLSKTYLPVQMARSKLKFQNPHVKWSGAAWICAKELKHYPAFFRNGTAITVHSFVFIMVEEKSHYLGYLEDMYEDKKGQKKVKVRWFHHNQEVKGVIPQLNPHPQEVFITPNVQVIDAEYIDCQATVLTPRHYDICMAVVPHASTTGFHLCFRQFKNNKIKPFALTKLHGYSNQAILSTLDGSIVPEQKIRYHNRYKEELTHDNWTRVGSKRNRTSKEPDRLESGSGLRNSACGNQLAKCKSGYTKLKLRLSKKTKGIEFVIPQSRCPSPFKVNEKIELLCQDSGVRGCWFRCKVLQASQKHLKVQYEDIHDVEGSGNLEEWVPSSRVAAPDKLGMRCFGRQTIRPQPQNHSTENVFEVGTPVDAWWSDGWWEGIAAGVDISGSDCLRVYLPGEGKFLAVPRKNTRSSRDWVDNKWVDVMAKPNILQYLSSDAISSIKLETQGCDSAASLEHKVVKTSNLNLLKRMNPYLVQLCLMTSKM
ncbi:Agenet domain-containing protein / bromo-adjacent domain-containing [Salix suchowensis]|nr:Agenet domain-containing protein / bromo-adjacent domain-containing [Salix suchowensis]